MANEDKGEVCAQLATACRELANAFDDFGKRQANPDQDRETWFQAVQALREVLNAARAHEFALTESLGLAHEGDDTEQSATMATSERSRAG